MEGNGEMIVLSFLWEKCCTCEEIDTLSFHGLPHIRSVPIERRNQLADHLRRRVDHCGRKAQDFQKCMYDWQREGTLASTHLFYWNLAAQEAEREATAPLH